MSAQLLTLLVPTYLRDRLTGTPFTITNYVLSVSLEFQVSIQPFPIDHVLDALQAIDIRKSVGEQHFGPTSFKTVCIY